MSNGISNVESKPYPELTLYLKFLTLVFEPITVKNFIPKILVLHNLNRPICVLCTFSYKDKTKNVC